MYGYEKELVEAFCYHINQNKNPFKIKNIACEFNYRNGIVDILGLKGKTVLYSFEAKLAKWKNALDQAYRNSSFVNYSYVLLPENRLNCALDNKSEFLRRKVGLCTLSDKGLKILIKAPKKSSIQPWLSSSALSYILENSHG